MKCVKCVGNPVLTHTDIPLSNANDKCSACGRGLSAVGSKCYLCSKCTYKLCDTCRICANSHFMTKAIYLGKTSPGYGQNNSFNCDICKKNGNTDDNGIWHCTPCTYDSCRSCLP